MATNYVAPHQRLLNGQELTYGKTSFSFPIIRFQLCHSSNVFTTHTATSHIQNSINVEDWEEMWSAKSQWLCHKKFTHVLNKFYLKVTPSPPQKEAYPIWRIAVGCPIKADVAQGAIIRVVGGFGTYNGSCGSSNTFWMYSGVLDLFLWLSTMGL